ncbi:MAG: hypothetical protein IPN73_11655 [Saprospiraceae bacterium]|jgi:hypothetical protein|nr:hypothetical protein [Saprospiraceae bacterium]MBK7789919.1 hypothetical protein [Saprospiraceae bacterium]MBK8110267.1 hypothetical protein [Saprospiraceae bacterium]MBK8850795.1 hypothetical protein [Saprospiraceae bacterium]MBK9689743.1 hypothetical protein [Saprospiraceae bacterium]
MATKLYMVELIVHHIPYDEFITQLPEHRKIVHELIYKDIFLSYTVAQDRSKVWIMVKSESESELIHYIEKLPLTRYMDYEYTELMFMEWAPVKLNFSLN